MMYAAILGQYNAMLMLEQDDILEVYHSI